MQYHFSSSFALLLKSAMRKGAPTKEVMMPTGISAIATVRASVSTRSSAEAILAIVPRISFILNSSPSCKNIKFKISRFGYNFQKFWSDKMDRKELLGGVKRIVVKVGTSTLANADGSLNEDKIKQIVI